MQKQVWKFLLSLDLQQTVVLMPTGAEILTAQIQEDQLCLWALVDPTQPPTPRILEVYGTGMDIHCETGTQRRYIATVPMDGGLLVAHVFEKTGWESGSMARR